VSPPRRSPDRAPWPAARPPRTRGRAGARPAPPRSRGWPPPRRGRPNGPRCCSAARRAPRAARPRRGVPPAGPPSPARARRSRASAAPATAARAPRRRRPGSWGWGSRARTRSRAPRRRRSSVPTRARAPAAPCPGHGAGGGGGWRPRSSHAALAREPEDDVLVDVLDVVAQALQVAGHLEEPVGPADRRGGLEHVGEQLALDLFVEVVDLLVHGVRALGGLGVLLGVRLHRDVEHLREDLEAALQVEVALEGRLLRQVQRGL